MFRPVVIGQARETKPDVVVIHTADGQRIGIGRLEDIPPTMQKLATDEQEQRRRRLRLALLN